MHAKTRVKIENSLNSQMIWSEAFDENDRLEFQAAVIVVSFFPTIGATTRERESEPSNEKRKS